MSKYLSKYPYFVKIGRPSKLEQYVCLKINNLLNDGKISEAGIEKWKKTNGSPTNLEELEYMYYFLTGEDAKVPKNKYYTGKRTPTPDVSNNLETTICDKSKVAFKKEEPIKHSLSLKKLTKEYCIADARRYKTKKEWIQKSSALYQYAYKKHWLNECTAHMVVTRPNKRTKEFCIANARRYKTLKEWRENSPTIHIYAYKKGWLNECTAHMVSFDNSRTKEDCIADARKYKTLKEWRENSSAIYLYAFRKGWLNECTAHMVVLFECKKRTKEDCIADALKYKTLKEWRENSSKINQYAYKKGWLNECTAHMISGDNKRTKEDCIADALKYKTLKEWRENSRAIKEDCIADARRYKTKKEWRENSRPIYDYAYRKGWLNECTSYMVSVDNKRTKEECIADARKYKTFKEWRENSSAFYQYAKRNGWLNECTSQIYVDLCEPENISSSATKKDTRKPFKKGGVVPKNKHITDELTPTPASELEKTFYTPEKCKEPTSNKSEISFDILKNGQHIISLYFSDNEKSTNWLLKSIQAFDSEKPKTNTDSVVDSEVKKSKVNSDLKNQKSRNSLCEKIKRVFFKKKV